MVRKSVCSAEKVRARNISKFATCFFKWVKQHLRIKTFYGRSENAVKTQIWIAVSVYALVAIIKKRMHLDHSLYTIPQVLSVTVFDKYPLYQILTNYDRKWQDDDYPKQLNLFD